MESPPAFGNVGLTDLKQTGGYTLFAENLPIPDTSFEQPVDADGSPVALVVMKNNGFAESSSHTDSHGTLTVRVRLQSTVTIPTGHSQPLSFVNAAGDRADLKGVLHWAWAGAWLYIFPADGVDASTFNSMFAAGDTIFLSKVQSPLALEDNLGLSFVSGTDASDTMEGDPGWRASSRNARLRYGSTPSAARDYFVWTINVFPRVVPGSTFFFRQYVVTGNYADAAQLSRDFVPHARQGFVTNHSAVEGFGGRELVVHARSHSSALPYVAVSTSSAESAVMLAVGCPVVCSGRSTPLPNLRALFHITCGQHSYIGHDPEHFNTEPGSPTAVRAYDCGTGDSTGDQPTFTLLGFFPLDSCSAVQSATLNFSDCHDQCPDDPNKVLPGSCDCGTSDADSDGDGALDNCAFGGQPQDACVNDANKTVAGSCGCGVSDVDSDGDGALDNCAFGGQPQDACVHDANKTVAGSCGCGVSDVDSDGDGALDNCAFGGQPQDACVHDANKTVAGSCGCGVSDVDSDGDGALDNCSFGGQAQDACVNDANKTVAGSCGCGVSDVDSDGDGALDNCAFGGQPQDACVHDANKTVAGSCGCGVSDVDSDGDGALDNCAFGGQPQDACVHDANKTVAGSCGCGVSDVDSDGDGALDNCAFGGQPRDECVDDAEKVIGGMCGCGLNDVDSDGDHVADCKDACPQDALRIVASACGCDASCGEVVPTCSDQLTNGDESDIDCGGSCDPCAVGMLCSHPSDCDGQTVCAQLDAESVCAVANNSAREAGQYVAVEATISGAVTHNDFRGELAAAFVQHLSEVLGVPEDYIVIDRVRTTNSIAVSFSVRVPPSGAEDEIVSNLGAALASNASNAGGRSNLANALVQERPELAAKYVLQHVVCGGGGVRSGHMCECR